MRYYIIAGEASGDLHGANLMQALKAADPDAEFRYYGGDLMQSVGGAPQRHYRELAYMGFFPVLFHLPTILKARRQCKADIVGWKPDAVVLIDYPGFNLDIAKFVHANTQIPVFYYISPKLWAWKEYRIKAIRRDVYKVLSILPFEVEYFKKLDYEVTYVGNPCVDAIESFKTSKEGQEAHQVFIADNNLPDKPIIALLAGSRRQEIRDNLRIMIQSTADIAGHQVVIAGAPGIEPDYYRRFIPKESDVSVVFGQTYRLLSHSEAALVTSGTATLETALLRVPQVVCYYIACGRMVSWLRKRLLKVKYISLVNLIAGREVVTELVADRMTVDNVRRCLHEIMEEGSCRRQMLENYEEVITTLGPCGASQRAAKEIVEKLAVK